MLNALNSYDWAEVFGEGTGGNTKPIIPDTAPGDPTSRATFCREDVAIICGQIEGKRDGDTWIVWGQLLDGRWFIARGWCDFTGWDCRANNSGNVASTKIELIDFGMDETERERFIMESNFSRKEKSMKNKKTNPDYLPNKHRDRFSITILGTVERYNSETLEYEIPLLCPLLLNYEICELESGDQLQHTNKYEVPVLINIIELGEKSDES